jgi:mono/diheme cytochrome c family protein
MAGTRTVAIAAFVFVAAFALSVSARQEQSADSVWAGVFTEEQAKRGEAVYQQTCLNCHGPGLEGADMTPPLAGGGFTSNWNDLTVGDLFERIRLTMPADSPGKLSRQQNSEVIAFILKANNWPSGANELARDLAVLKQIKITSSKPPGRP